MRISDYWLRRTIASSLVMLVAVPFGEAATSRTQQAPPTQQVEGGHSVESPTQSQNSDNTAKKPLTDTTTPEASPNNPGSAGPPTVDGNQQPGTPPPAPQQQQNNTSKPVGTAAAPYEKTTGVAASRPAGAAIAPAKQKRARSFLIKIAVVVGAAVAVGTIVGLSKASPSHPQ